MGLALVELVEGDREIGGEALGGLFGRGAIVGLGIEGLANFEGDFTAALHLGIAVVDGDRHQANIHIFGLGGLEGHVGGTGLEGMHGAVAEDIPFGKDHHHQLSPQQFYAPTNARSARFLGIDGEPS